MAAPLSSHAFAPPRRRLLPDLLLCLALGLTWYVLIQIRPSITTFHCAQHLQACTREGVLFPPDRWVIGLDSPVANALSFATEYAGALLALVSPWLALKSANRPLRWSARTRHCTRQWIPLLQATLLNGVWMESARNWVQRPRPFVYEAPLAYGRVVSHYTSFYAGHTSFTAAASVMAWLTSRRLGASPEKSRRIGLAGLSLTFLTGLFRVLAARHFITDVLFGAVAGAAASGVILHVLHRRIDSPELPSERPPGEPQQA